MSSESDDMENPGYRIGFSRGDAIAEYGTDKRAHESPEERAIFHAVSDGLWDKVKEYATEGGAKQSDIISGLCCSLGMILASNSPEDAKKLYGIMINRICFYEEYSRNS